VDFFARQEAARRATRWLLVAFLVSVALVVAAVGMLVYAVAGMKTAPGESAMTPAVLAGIVTLLVICGASLFKTMSLRAGGGVVARSLGGTRVEGSTRDLGLRRLHNVVEEMAIAAGVTMPEVYVLESEEGINAFAAGNSPADAAVAVTRGAITRLNREELQGVIAHEFSHVLNGDMRLNSKLLGWVFGLLVVAIAARLFMHGVGRGSRRNDKGGALVLVALAVMIIGYIGVFVGRILQASVSRHRERLADASAVQFTRNPSGLVGALLKIAGVSSGSKLESPATDEVAHMLFAPGMARLFATHPSISERVRELDPGMQRQNLQALAAAAAHDAERLRLAPSFTDLEAPAATPQFAPHDAAASTAQLTSLAGTFDEVQQRYAHSARLAMPEGLHGFAESPDAARVLLFAMLRGADEQVAARQDEVIRRSFGEPMLAAVHAAVATARGLPAQLRLPAVQQLLPALRHMTHAEREELRAATQQFALADDRLDVFECCLLLLLESTLHDSLERGEEHGRHSLLQDADAAGTLFAVLAAHGSADADTARRAYDAGIALVLPHHRRSYAPVPQWPEALRQSLRQLNSLRPSAKKTLIDGMVRTVTHDERLAVEEGELLRTVCAVLHCPMPPILDAPR
jgi:Zn-dependent protease with chaperone function